MSKFALRRRQQRLSWLERWLENGTWLMLGYSAYGSGWWALIGLVVWIVRVYAVTRLEIVNAKLAEVSS